MKRTISTSLIALLPITFAACGGSGGSNTGGDCSPGAGGNTAKYVTDTVTVPIDHTKFAIDVNGDGRPDNQLGYIIGALIGQNLDVQTGVNDAISMGKLVILNAETSADATFTADACASSALSLGVNTTTAPDFSGNGTFTVDKSAGDSFAGPISNGKFDSASPVTTHTPVSVEIKLPLIQGADPVTLDVQGAHIQYTRSGDKVTGGELHGIIPEAKVQSTIIPNVASLLTFKMKDGSAAAKQIASIFDTGGTADAACNKTCKNPDGTCAKASDMKIDVCEVSTSGIIQNVLSPDVKMFDASGKWAPNSTAKKEDADSLSLGIGFTMVKASF